MLTDGCDPRLFRLLQLASPALPVGAFSWSQGLESAVDTGWVRDEREAESWIGGLLSHSVGRLDVPVLMRLHGAWAAQDQDALGYWNGYLFASRSSRELRMEEVQMGQALARLLSQLDLTPPQEITIDRPGYALLFALAGVRWGLSDRATAAAFVWGFLENQVAAAVKLVPLGQSAGQKILARLCDRIPRVIETAALLSDRELGGLSPAVSLLSAMHETQHTRLFRS